LTFTLERLYVGYYREFARSEVDSGAVQYRRVLQSDSSLAKALRLYDELGLLRPAYVDPDNGYRHYDVSQLEEARTGAVRVTMYTEPPRTTDSIPDMDFSVPLAS
jgi:hypothetical protein